MTIDPVPVSSPASSALHLVPPPSVASAPSVPSSAESAASLDSLELIERHFEPAFDQLGASRLQVYSSRNHFAKLTHLISEHP